MNGTNLMLSMVFSTVGLGFILYAKKAGVILPAAAGLVLMVLPFFISNNVVMTLVCLVLTAIPFVIRDV
jgi:hypothetical protein